MPDDQADHKQDPAAETEAQNRMHAAEEPETEAHRRFMNDEQPEGLDGMDDEPETEAHGRPRHG